MKKNNTKQGVLFSWVQEVGEFVYFDCSVENTMRLIDITNHRFKSNKLLFFVFGILQRISKQILKGIQALKEQRHIKIKGLAGIKVALHNAMEAKSTESKLRDLCAKYNSQFFLRVV